MLSGIISAVGSLGGQWLDNRREKSKATHEQKMEGIRAKTRVSVAKAEAEIAREQHRDHAVFTLDQMAVKEGRESKWDEFICLIALLPFIYTAMVYPTTAAALDNRLVLPQEIWEAMAAVPGYYWVLIFGIFARYLGLRGWFRDMRIGKKLLNIKPSVRENLPTPTSSVNGTHQGSPDSRELAGGGSSSDEPDDDEDIKSAKKKDDGNA